MYAFTPKGISQNTSVRSDEDIHKSGLGVRLSSMSPGNIIGQCNNVSNHDDNLDDDETETEGANMSVLLKHLLGRYTQTTSRISMTEIVKDLVCQAYSTPTAGDQCSLSTIHSSKGLEARRIVLMLTSHSTLYEQATMRTKMDPLSRNLLYVALTRARDDAIVALIKNGGENALGASQFLGIACGV